jgi:sensor histidine kinase YesM
MAIAHNPVGSKMLADKTILAKRYRFWLLQSGGWLLFGFIDLYASSQMTGPVPMSGKHVFAWATSLLTGFCISLIIWPLYKVTYRRSKSILSYVLVSVLCTLTGSFLWLTLKDLIEQAIKLGMPYSIWSQSHASGFVDYITVNILFLSVPLFAWSFLYFGYRLVADLNAEKTKYQTTLLQAKEAELHMLRYQINPHFLFNSLNSIQALMYRNTAQADEMLTEFSEFLRYTLENKDDVHVSLGHEIEMISKYLYIEKIRHQEKLSYTIDVSENTREIKVLSFLLQPLVENALKHGSKSAEGVLRIHIKTLKANGHLLIRILNSGPWRKQEAGKGIGIENVRKRLENAYPFKHSLNIEEKKDWVVVEIKLVP